MRRQTAKPLTFGVSGAIFNPVSVAMALTGIVTPYSQKGAKRYQFLTSAFFAPVEYQWWVGASLFGGPASFLAGGDNSHHACRHRLSPDPAGLFHRKEATMPTPIPKAAMRPRGAIARLSSVPRQRCRARGHHEAV